jgi:hypothetical protein
VVTGGGGVVIGRSITGGGRIVVGATGSVRHLKTLYAELRRCRIRCDRKPFIEHKADGEHDCVLAKCKPHVCRPMAARRCGRSTR